MKRAWKSIALGSDGLLTEMQPGYACGKKDVVGGVVHLRMNNVTKEGSFDATLLRRIPRDVAEKQGMFVEKDDVIFVNTNSTELVGKSVVFPGWSEPCAFSNHLTKLRPDTDKLHPVWLHLCFRKLWHDGFFAANCIEFIGQSTFNKEQLRELEIPVPPLAEQRRLVARIEALTSRLEQARQARQAALAEGELIMQSHRCRLLEDYFEENFTRFGELVAETQLGLVRSKEQQSDAHPWPYLKMNNITTAGTLDLSKVTSVQASDDEAEKFRLAYGDFLFNTRNSHELVGKTAVWTGNGEPFLYNNNIMRIRFRPGVEPRFVNAVFLTPAVQSQLDGFKKQTTSVCAIYWKNLKDVEIPLPPLTEQERIADSLDALAAKQTELRRLQTETEAELAAFTPALLAKAFRGEL
jgi:restriction endonuclease S subunit